MYIIFPNSNGMGQHNSANDHLPSGAGNGPRVSGEPSDSQRRIMRRIRPSLEQQPSATHEQHVDKGQVVFDSRTQNAQPYLVSKGEVLIFCNNHLVDIVEAGEYLDPVIWGQATAIAYTDCRLVVQPLM
ncbi:MAG: hypothetical protein KDD78_18375 [Caldilineaceae bacterium]|nr:hypothetical protein [Caldilineaceae bacterium]